MTAGEGEGHIPFGDYSGELKIHPDTFFIIPVPLQDQVPIDRDTFLASLEPFREISRTQSKTDQVKFLVVDQVLYLFPKASVPVLKATVSGTYEIEHVDALEEIKKVIKRPDAHPQAAGVIFFTDRTVIRTDASSLVDAPGRTLPYGLTKETSDGYIKEMNITNFGGMFAVMNGG